MVIANKVTNNANPPLERPAVAQLHGLRTNKKQRCKLNFYVELVDTLLMNSGDDEALTKSADNVFHTGIDLT